MTKFVWLLELDSVWVAEVASSFDTISDLAGSGKFFANFFADEPGLFIYFLVSGWLMVEEVLETFPYLVEVMKLAPIVFLNVTQGAVLLTLRHVDFLFLYS